MPEPSSERVFVYIGTYTKQESEGIYIYRMDPSTGELSKAGVAPGVVNPSFLAIEPRRPTLYAVCEVADFNGQPAGAVSAFLIDRETGQLNALNAQSSRGGGPCYVSIDHSGEFAFAANYGGGSVCMLPIHEDGSLGEATGFVQHEGSSVNPERQKEPHTHSILPDPTNTYVLSADLGMDKILIYRMDKEDGKLVPNDMPWAKVKPGAGPRHLAFHPSGRYVYVINEIDNTVTAFRYDASRGSLEEIQTLSTLPEDFTGKSSCAEILVAPSGRFVYGSNRGHDSIVIYRIDEGTGRLELVGHESVRGKNPRNFNLDPSGAFMYVANQDTDNVVAFRVDSESGRLAPTGHEIRVSMPVCVKMIALA
ncbi:MAG: lactonase family protein [Armatimonadetes bacterium]|nr:lactonase family protein [Armatimonadota bacterium]